MSADVEIRTFNCLSIRKQEAPIIHLLSLEAQALLVFLARTGRAHAREDLADLLWGEHSPDRLADLETVLDGLRTLVPHITSDHQAVSLDAADAIWLDANAFEALAYETPNRALELYKGDFLDGFSTGSPAFEDWVSGEREHLRQRAAEAGSRLMLDQETLHEEPDDALVNLPDTRPITQVKLIRGYTIRERIGVGGFGEVCRAFQPIGHEGRDVAIKIIKPEYANHPDFIRRFETEAQLIARLEHMNIVPLYDYWREPSGAYLVMRWLPYSLRDRLLKGPLSVHACARLVEQVAAALTVAHRAGVVHRDLKPANIMLDDDGNAYLADFGIAKVISSSMVGTQENILIGSPAYLSPEQIRGEPVTSGSDIYSFGILLYEALTGHLPFPKDLAPSTLLYRQLNTLLPSLLETRPDLPPTLDSVIQRATAKDPDERFANALSLAAAFRAAVGSAHPPDVLIDPNLPAAVVPLPDDQTWTPADSLVLLRNPYKGLRAFGEADAADFFGRDTLVNRLLARLSETDPLARFLAVVGPSGSGKSSVVRAGLIPRLRHGALPGSEDWFFAEMMPGTRPLDELEIALLHVAVHQPPSLIEQLERDANGLTRAAKLVLPKDNELCILIDQFEEIFMLAENPAHTRHLLNLIHAAVTDPRSRVRVIVTLRADFYDRPLMFPAFGDLLRQRTEVVLPLTPTELEQAIAEPARRVGVTLEPALIAAIVAEVSEHLGALPMLQYALTELFERRSNATLTQGAYTDLGGVLGVLAQRADEIYCDLDPCEQDATRQMFLRLVTLGEGTEDTRRRVLESEVLALGGDEMRMILDTFDKSRLLTFDRDPVTRSPTVEVAHEALLREWTRLRAWLDESRDDIRQQRMLATASQEWEQSGQEPDFLLRGARLDQFVSWSGATRVALTEDERAFLDRSVADQQRRDAVERQRREREAEIAREAQQYARRARQFRLWAIVLGAVFMLALGSTVAFWFSRSDALATQSTVEYQSTLFGLEQQRAQTLVAGVGMVPPASDALEPAQFIATQTQIAHLTRWEPRFFTDAYGVEMVEVPAGCFWMGSVISVDEQPVHEVCFTEPFWIDRTEVTNEQFTRLNGQVGREGYWTEPNRPRENVTWLEAHDFCASRDARLPSEAEWEYAARGPDSAAYPWGNDFVADYGAYRVNSKSATSDVGSRPEGASWVGALDMSGNVWEWVNSIYLDYPYTPDDGRESEDDCCGLRVLRGGSWLEEDSLLARAAVRLYYSPFTEDYNLGFRCARSGE